MPAHFDLCPVKVFGAVTLNTGGTATATSAAVDTIQNNVRYDRAIVQLLTATIAANGNLSVFKLQSCDTSGGTYTDVTGGTATALPDEDSDDVFLQIDVDLQKAGAKRYLKVVATTSAAANFVTIGCWINLTSGQVVPNKGDSVGSYTLNGITVT